MYSSSLVLCDVQFVFKGNTVCFYMYTFYNIWYNLHLSVPGSRYLHLSVPDIHCFTTVCRRRSLSPITKCIFQDSNSVCHSNQGVTQVTNKPLHVSRNTFNIWHLKTSIFSRLFQAIPFQPHRSSYIGEPALHRFNTTPIKTATV